MTRSSANNKRWRGVELISTEPELLSNRYFSMLLMRRLNSNGLKLQPWLTPFLYRNSSDVSELRVTLEEA